MGYTIFVIRKVRPEDRLWPKKIGNLGRGAPKQLWYGGKWGDRLFEKCAAVVGSRRMTEYGRRVLEKLVPMLVNGGWTIVSGMMYGTDQYAHRLTMDCGGKTVGVLGYGIKYQGIMNDDLGFMNMIIDSGGLILSEWEDQAGTLWTFPMRDRIMAALAQEIYVTEAAIKSGALITAEWGKKLGRKVWAVPGPITSRVSEGTNKIITEGWATMWVPEMEDQKAPGRLSDSNNTDIYSLLQNETLKIDEIARKLSMQVAEVGSRLTMMQMTGEVEEKNGKYYLPVNRQRAPDK